ncbi:MAG: hypothetical protein LBG91_01610, partial [Treponema sp.]|nr:hypothetical protein [Treponema sp.]
SADKSGDKSGEEPDEEHERVDVDVLDQKPQITETIIPVKNLDKDIPFYSLPKDLPKGRYTMVFHVLGRKEILHKTEKPFFYLADTDFLFRDIHIHIPGIAADSQIIPNSTTIMVEARLDFDSSLEPYIVWYSGKKIIGEGSYSDGMGNLLLKAPEQNSFLSLRAEVFPVIDRRGLVGYPKEIHLPVSSKAPNIHVLSGDVPGLLYWYLFEGNLNDSRMPVSAGRVLKPVEKKAPKWSPANGTYGLVTGKNDIYTLPKVSFSNDGTTGGQFLFRFKPMEDGSVFTVKFGPSFDVVIYLDTKDENLVLTLSSPLKTVSETLTVQKDAFVTAAVDFSIRENYLIARFGDFGNSDQQDGPDSVPVVLAAALDGGLEIALGSLKKTSAPVSGDTAETDTDEPKPVEPEFTALWDEFALLSIPPIEIEIEEMEIEEEAEEVLPTDEASQD